MQGGVLPNHQLKVQNFAAMSCHDRPVLKRQTLLATAATTHPICPVSVPNDEQTFEGGFWHIFQVFCHRQPRATAVHGVFAVRRQM